MSAEDRTAMIEGMVAKLAARLEDNPDDPEGWARLIRSRMIMGDASGARSALDTATSVFAGMPEKLAIVMASARESGLPVN
jgi:cytochrome c-type biogenesis protein CcmH